MELKLNHVITYGREELNDRIWERVGYRDVPYLKVMREGMGMQVLVLNGLSLWPTCIHPILLFIMDYKDTCNIMHCSFSTKSKRQHVLTHLYPGLFLQEWAPTLRTGCPTTSRPTWRSSRRRWWTGWRPSSPRRSRWALGFGPRQNYQ